jgi:hypothetical protein
VTVLRSFPHSPGTDGWRLFTQKQEGVIMALLRHTETGQHLVAACTHVFWWAIGGLVVQRQ